MSTIISPHLFQSTHGFFFFFESSLGGLSSLGRRLIHVYFFLLFFFVTSLTNIHWLHQPCHRKNVLSTFLSFTTFSVLFDITFIVIYFERRIAAHITI